MIGVKDTTALAISAYRTVPIQDRKIVINTPAAWYATLTGVSVTGRMTPAEPGKELALQDYLGSGTWRLLSIAKMDAAGNFRLRVPDDVPSTRTVRVLTRYVSQPAMEYSGLAKIVIKAALNPKVYAVSAAHGAEHVPGRLPGQAVVAAVAAAELLGLRRPCAPR